MKKTELDLKQFMSAAAPDDVTEFVDLFCGKSRNYLYQIAGGHRKLGAKRAVKAAVWFKSKKYNVPLHKIRPDIWGEEAAA